MTASHLTRVEGAPFGPGDFVRVGEPTDSTSPGEKDSHTTRSYKGSLGLVVHLDYACGCGQTFPHDPMIGVRFASGETEEFWSEELALVRAAKETG